MSPRRIAVLSGGLDSTAALAEMLAGRQDAPEPLAVSFAYGQRHVRELDAARQVAAHYGIEHRLIELDGLLSGGSLLGEGEVPDGSYAPETLASTVVHGRNLLFASIAVSLAGQGGEVWLGVHGGDHELYPDCRPEFWVPIIETVAVGYGVAIRLPFLKSSKAEIVRRGLALSAPLGMTWSCYRGEAIPCGTCSTCRERTEAFAEVGVADPALLPDEV